MRRHPSTQRNQLLPALGAYVLENGLAQASLRPMAQAAGTSDRMLIYHFTSKDQMIEAVLEHLASELEIILTGAMPVHRSSSIEACFSEVMHLLRRNDVRRYLLVWLEIVAAAGLGNERFGIVGAQMLKRFLPWLEERLPDGIADREATAATLLALVEGCIVMDAVGMTATADQAGQTLARLGPRV